MSRGGHGKQRGSLPLWWLLQGTRPPTGQGGENAGGQGSSQVEGRTNLQMPPAGSLRAGGETWAPLQLPGESLGWGVTEGVWMQLLIHTAPER